MSVLNENISIKIKDVCFMSWDKSRVEVAARNVHALVYREKGIASFVCGGKTAETKKGDVFYMPAGVSYFADYGEYNEIYAFHFESDCISDMENFRITNTEAVGHLFKKAAEIWQSRRNGYYFSVMAIFAEITENLSRSYLTQRKGGYPESFLKMCEYMEADFTSSDLSIEALADMAHISGTYFRNLFVSKYGINPSKYINGLRLAYAEKLLAEGRHSVEEVAALSGFNDAKYFSRQIKKEYGVPPSRLYKFK